MGREPYRFVHEFASSTGALVEARRRFGLWLSAQAIDPAHCDELTVAMSELGANAVTAADGDRRGAITVRAWREHADVVLEVENAPQQHVGSIVFHGDDDPLRGNGRGLLIVTAYTDSVEVIPPDHGKGLIVRCRKHV